MASQDRFGYEWRKYHWLDKNYELQFQKWIQPFKPEIFKNKKVLDAGCGMGRNSFWALNYGAKELLAFDYDQNSLEAAKKNLSRFKNAKVDFQNIYHLPYQNEFDIVFCIGVIHHLKNPDLALKNLVKAAKPNGLIIIWVYSHEGNEWIVRLINPLRKNIFSKLPVGLLHTLSYLASLPLYLYVKTVPQTTPYLKQLSQFRFKHIHSIVFDQLLPEVAHYWKKEEAYHLLAKQNLSNIQLVWTNQVGWTVSGYKKA